MAGKGSNPRPISNRKQFIKNWDDIDWNQKVIEKTLQDCTPICECECEKEKQKETNLPEM